VNFDVSHRTTFTYSQRVSISHHLLHLAPRSCPHQLCSRHSLMIEPPPTIMKSAIDYFGNPTTYLTIEEPHTELSIIARSNVDVVASDPYPSLETTPWDGIPAALARATDREMLDVYQFAFDSPFASFSEAARDYAQPSFAPGRPVLDGAIELMHRIFADFKYEGGVTDIYTPIETVLTDRRGVCQDFAHLFIAALRSLGIPARYVSGYLMTRPPEGAARLVGADASHAWLSVWVPEAGWVDLDPTNDLLPGEHHITVAWGRDYGDVSPVNGMVLGGGKQKIEVAVDVAPVEIVPLDA
jgi:transglutaminase-like putative cysteine protease